MSDRTILIADDEPYLTFMLATRLRELGAKVLVASDGEEALRLARENLPTLILTDLQMPCMTGLELAQQLQTQPATASIPLVLLTARGHRVPAADIAQTNIRHLVLKPFSTKELMGIVQELCGLEQTAGTRARAA
jgi:two-component system alkaline phosphatase synthesis response regulator PhoP